nr:MAG TPA: hypothetical protein [Caudoviricetes sp.]
MSTATLKGAFAPLFSFFRKRKVNIQIRASCPYYFQSKKGTEYAERL